VRRTRRFLLGIVLLGLAVLSGCKGPPPTKQQFNDTFALDNKKLFKAGRDFRKALEPLQQGQNVTGAVKKAYDDVESLIKEIEDELDDMQLPRKSGTAKGYLEAYKDFIFEIEDKRVLQKHMKRIVDIVNDKELAPNEKWDRIQPILITIDVEEQEYPPGLEKNDPKRMGLNVVKEYQKKYCESHNLRPVSFYQKKE
jgi:hypothetical protein